MKLLLHPLPIRIFHWIMFAAVIMLLFTGFILHSSPGWLKVPTSLVRKLHGVFALLLSANFSLHVYYYAYTRKFTEVLLLPRDWINVRSFLRYYLFVTGNHPNFGRYNPGQKLLFTSWGLAIVAATVSGGALFFPSESVWLQRMVGGLNNIRIIKYLIAVFFASSIPLHLYLVFTEQPAKLQAMFTGYIQKEPDKVVNMELYDDR